MEMVRVKWLGRKLPKIVELPVPFVAMSDKIGEVICNPIGEFDKESADYLLGLGGNWERVEEPEVSKELKEPEASKEPEATKAPEQGGSPTVALGPECQCGCGEHIISKPHHKRTGPPKYIKGHSFKAARNRKAAITEATEGGSKEAITEKTEGQGG